MHTTETEKPMIANLMRLTDAEYHDPHTLLGLHAIAGGKKVIRLFRPGADAVYFELFGKTVQAEKSQTSGLFEYLVPAKTTVNDYRVYHQDGFLAHDPYAFWPTIGELDQYLFAKGVHYNLYNRLGAHKVVHQGIAGVKFAVWAPSAKRVSLVADFNHWDGRTNPMRSMGQSGIWELFVPGLNDGQKYKFEIKTQSGEIRVKADPYAFSSELRPATASVVATVDSFPWDDAAWMEKRDQNKHLPQPRSR